MTTKRPANDGGADETALRLVDELTEEAAHANGADAALQPDAEAHHAAARGRALVARGKAAAAGVPFAAALPTVPPRTRDDGSHAAIDLGHLQHLAGDGPPTAAPLLAIGSQDGDATAADRRDPDTARLRRMSRDELIDWIAVHPQRELERDLLGVLSDEELRDEVRTRRDCASTGGTA